jgi:hypothetical protein
MEKEYMNRFDSDSFDSLLLLYIATIDLPINSSCLSITPSLLLSVSKRRERSSTSKSLRGGWWKHQHFPKMMFDVEEEQEDIIKPSAAERKNFSNNKSKSESCYCYLSGLWYNEDEVVVHLLPLPTTIKQHQSLLCYACSSYIIRRWWW